MILNTKASKNKNKKKKTPANQKKMPLIADNLHGPGRWWQEGEKPMKFGRT